MSQPPPPATPLRLAVTGATGFIGTALVGELRARGHAVRRVTRAPSGPGDVRWDPARGELDAGALADVDAVIHLAGENVGERWTDEQKRRIRDSRVRGTGLVARALASLGPRGDGRPRALVSASATGYYGDTGDREATEASPPGTGFLADVVRAWEDAASPARAAGCRVVHPRIGLVLHRDGGALARMLPPFRLGLGGRLGDGEQWMSWISRDDTVRALAFLAEHATIAGPVNVVAPAPARNAGFTSALGHALHRPAVAAVPAFALRLAFGQMADETLLVSQRVRSDRLQQAGFAFTHPALDAALAAALAEAA